MLKDVRVNSTHYLIIRINNRKELQNIAISHSADIDYNNFMRIYRECTREPYCFLTIYTSLSAGDPLRFRKKSFNTLIKLTVTDEIKILDDKIKSNQVQYDLGREAAKVSALPSKHLSEKYEYLNGEDLGHKPSEYCPLGMT